MKAFPTPTFSISEEARVTSIGGEGGMELRDYFAAKALQGILAQETFDYDLDIPENIAAYAYGLADHMMKARES